MLIAFGVIIAVFIIFIVAVYFIMKKSYKFNIVGREVVVKNAGAYLKIFVDQKLNKSFYMPDLIKGENFAFNVDDNEYTLKCQSNSFGSKLSLQIYKGEEQVADNGVTLKKSSKNID